MPLTAMPTDVILVVTAIVAVFCLFAAVLAWGDHQTRSIPSNERPSQRSANVDVVKTLMQRANANDATATTGVRSPDKSTA